MSVPDDLVAYFASMPMDPVREFEHEAREAHSPVRRMVDSYLALVPDASITAALADPVFQFMNEGARDIAHAARIWVAARTVDAAIDRAKIRLILEEAEVSRPSPYETSAVADLDVDKDHLLPLSAFEFDGSRLTRNQHAFLLLSTTGAPNSTHWLLQQLYEQQLDAFTRVRLDPFLHGAADEYPRMFYRMHVYGKDLDWDRLSKLSEEEHGEWFRLNGGDRPGVTQYNWSPRSDEVHFECEDINLAVDGGTQPARYLHAVYSRARRIFTHLDGALRIYSSDELSARAKAHLRKMSKIGMREKVFRVDGDVSTSAFSTLCRCFFVWNEDVQAYFQ